MVWPQAALLTLVLGPTSNAASSMQVCQLVKVCGGSGATEAEVARTLAAGRGRSISARRYGSDVIVIAAQANNGGNVLMYTNSPI